jgi:hypothetical protein
MDTLDNLAQLGYTWQLSCNIFTGGNKYYLVVTDKDDQNVKFASYGETYIDAVQGITNLLKEQKPKHKEYL